MCSKKRGEWILVAITVVMAMVVVGTVSIRTEIPKLPDTEDAEISAPNAAYYKNLGTISREFLNEELTAREAMDKFEALGLNKQELFLLSCSQRNSMISIMFVDQCPKIEIEAEILRLDNLISQLNQ